MTSALSRNSVLSGKLRSAAFRCCRTAGKQISTGISEFHAVQRRERRTKARSRKDRALARGIAEGMELGRQEGIDIGEERKSVDIARNLIMANMDESDIAEWTGLSPERIRKLKK